MVKGDKERTWPRDAIVPDPKVHTKQHDNYMADTSGCREKRTSDQPAQETKATEEATDIAQPPLFSCYDLLDAC